MIKWITPLVWVIAMLMLSGCKKEDPDSIAKRDRKTLQKYIRLEGREDDVIEHETGLFYYVEELGTGNHPKPDSWIKLNFVGYYLDDDMKDVNFDYGHGEMVQLQNEIRGWYYGISLFKSGGKGTLYIPSSLGYGPYPPFWMSIPRNACLVYDFQISEIQ